MLFVLAFLPIAAGGSKLDLQHELELQLLGDDQPMVLSSLSATSAKSVSLAHTAAILASQPAPLRPLGEDAATPSAAPAKSAVPAALRAMSGPQRVAVCELDTEKCRAVAAAFVDDADGVCDFFQSVRLRFRSPWVSWESHAEDCCQEVSIDSKRQMFCYVLTI